MSTEGHIHLLTGLFRLNQEVREVQLVVIANMMNRNIRAEFNNKTLKIAVKEIHTGCESLCLGLSFREHVQR